MPEFNTDPYCSETETAAASTWVDWSSETPAAAATTPAAAISSEVWAYTPTSSGVAPAVYTGAANALVANVGAGLAGVGAVAAFLL